MRSARAAWSACSTCSDVQGMRKGQLNGWPFMSASLSLSAFWKSNFNFRKGSTFAVRRTVGAVRLRKMAGQTGCGRSEAEKLTGKPVSQRGR